LLIWSLVTAAVADLVAGYCCCCYGAAMLGAAGEGKGQGVRGRGTEVGGWWHIFSVGDSETFCDDHRFSCDDHIFFCDDHKIIL